MPSAATMARELSSRLAGSSASPAATRQTMRALRIVAPRRVEIVYPSIPQPKPFQVRVRIEGCGVCGSNLALWQGHPWFDYPCPPGAPGHEGWGTIDQVGAEVTRFHPGDRVALLSDNAYAEYDVADADAVVPAPPGAAVFPGEALGCAINAFQRSAVTAGQTVAIIGIGFMGALLTQLAAAAGARVIAISRRPFALVVARRCGAREVLALRDRDGVTARVMALTAGNGCERVIEAAGTQETLDLAGALIAVRGRLIIAGYHQDASRVVNLQLWNWRGIDVINAHERDRLKYAEGMSAAAQAVAGGTLAPAWLYTHRFSLEHAAEAFAALETRPDGFLKAWIGANYENNEQH